MSACVCHGSPRPPRLPPRMLEQRRSRLCKRIPVPSVLHGDGDGGFRLCSSDACLAAADELEKLDRLRETTVSSLSAAKGMKSLRSQVLCAGGPWTPAADLENAESELRAALERIAAQEKAILDNLCRLCPNHPLCRVQA